MRAVRRLRLVVVVTAVLLATLLPASPVRAVTITVNTTGDGLVADGLCGLREAVQAANTDAPAYGCPAGNPDASGDVITVPAGTYNLTVPGAGEDLNVTGDLDVGQYATIRGAGAAVTVIDGQSSDRVFDLQGAGITIEGLTVTNGSADNGGAVRTTKGLTINRARVVSNTATGYGGGIYVTGDKFDDSTISGTVVAGNVAANGGGIFTDGEDLGDAGILSVDISTVSGNAAVDGDGIYVGKYGFAQIRNTTISGNGGMEGKGGGIYLAGDPTDVWGGARFSHATVTGNRAGSSAGSGGNLYQLADGVTSENTIFAHPMSGGNCSVPVRSTNGHNLEWSPFSGSSPCLGVADMTNVYGDPTFPLDAAGNVAPPADNGGSTPTLGLGAGSAALDAATTGTGTDQRGFPRGTAPDIGAYERIVCGGVPVNRIGTAGNDTITGTSGPDGILGLGGNDRINGLGGHDGLCGGPGNDRLDGGLGNDTIEPGTGLDRVIGGSNSDTVSYASSPRAVNLDLRLSTALASGQGRDTISGVENVVGTRFADVIRGNGSANWLRLGGGADSGFGYGGPDRIDGGSGSDRLFGGSGNDQLFGEAGNDFFDGGSGRDRCRQGPGTGRRISCELR